MPEIKIDLKDAGHLIGFGVPLPKEVERYRHIRKFTTHDPAALKAYVSGNIQCGQRTALLVNKDPQYECGVAIIDDHYEHLAVGERTLIHTAENIGKNIIRNTLALEGMPWITDYDMPLRGVPAFIVYSGPSLDRNIDLLSECKKHGVVFASNTPYSACVAAGVQPDVLCCLESRDVSNTMGDAKPDYYVCDMTGHENNWAVDAKHKIRCFQPDLAYFRYCQDAGTSPIGNGGFVGSLMAMLAYQWGADPIVLLGFDLALTDNKCCASNMRYSNVTCTISDDEMFVQYGGENNTHNKSFLTEVRDWHRTEKVKTTYERLGYIEWCRHFAEWTEGVELINATEGGAYLEGWRHQTLKETLNNAMWHRKLHSHRSRLDERTAELDKYWSENNGHIVVDRIRDACDEIISLIDVETPEAALRMRKISREEPLLYTLLAPKFVALRYQRPTEDMRIREVTRIIGECAQKMHAFIEELVGY